MHAVIAIVKQPDQSATHIDKDPIHRAHDAKCIERLEPSSNIPCYDGGQMDVVGVPDHIVTNIAPTSPPHSCFRQT